VRVWQDRYLECVVERIYYTNDKSDSGRLTRAEIERSNLLRVRFLSLSSLRPCLPVSQRHGGVRHGGTFGQKTRSERIMRI
jgi:hypothetical protein